MSGNDGNEGKVIREPVIVLTITYYPTRRQCDLQANTTDMILLSGMLEEAKAALARKRAEASVDQIVRVPPGLRL